MGHAAGGCAVLWQRRAGLGARAFPRAQHKCHIVCGRKPCGQARPRARLFVGAVQRSVHAQAVNDSDR
eukprot:6376107-Alexandrium_andersonii.AAC.2